MKTSPFLYFILFLIVVSVPYVLLSGRRKSKFRWGRKKKIVKMLQRYFEKNPKSNDDIKEIIHTMSPLFEKRGEIDYESMIDELEKITIENNDYKFIVDILVQTIKDNHPFLHVSSSMQSLFEKISNDLNENNPYEAKSDLKLLYEKFHEVESSLTRRGNIEFWIGVALSLAGIIYSVVSDLL